MKQIDALLAKIDAMLASKRIPKMQFYNAIPLSSASITAWKNGRSFPSFENLVKIADYFGITLSELLQTKKAPGTEPEAVELWRDYNALDDTGRRVVRAVMRELGRKEPVPEPTRTRIIPLLGQRFAAGRGEPDFGNPWEDYEIPADSHADFAVRVSGNSMEPYLPDGKIALCRKGAPADGDVAVLMVDGAFLVKQVCEDSFGNLYLFSLNRERKDADDMISRNSGRSVQCYGTVIMDKRVPLPGRGKV